MAKSTTTVVVFVAREVQHGKDEFEDANMNQKSVILERTYIITIPLFIHPLPKYKSIYIRNNMIHLNCTLKRLRAIFL